MVHGVTVVVHSVTIGIGCMILLCLQYHHPSGVIIQNFEQGTSSMTPPSRSPSCNYICSITPLCSTNNVNPHVKLHPSHTLSSLYLTWQGLTFSSGSLECYHLCSNILWILENTGSLYLFTAWVDWNSCSGDVCNFCITRTVSPDVGTDLGISGNSAHQHGPFEILVYKKLYTNTNMN